MRLGRTTIVTFIRWAGILLLSAGLGAILCARPPVPLLALTTWFEGDGPSPAHALLRVWASDPQWAWTGAAGAVLGMIGALALGWLVRALGFWKPAVRPPEPSPQAGAGGTPRYLKLACAGCVAILIMLWWFWPMHVGPPFSRSQFHAVRVGMTRQEEIAILGPPGHYASVSRDSGGPRHLRIDQEGDTIWGLIYDVPTGKPCVEEVWSDGPTMILLTFVDGKVHGRSWTSERSAWATALEEWIYWLRALVGLPSQCGP